MQLSQAIRLGTMIRPQAFEHVFTRGGSCALGAAYEACGVVYDPQCLPGTISAMEELDREWGLHQRPTNKHACPACGLKQSLALTITHLNDHHKWSRERIADHVATLESQPVQEEPCLVTLPRSI